MFYSFAHLVQVLILLTIISASIAYFITEFPQFLKAIKGDKPKKYRETATIKTIRKAS